MVISVRMKKVPQLYEQVLAQYPIELRSLTPVIDVPIELDVE